MGCCTAFLKIINGIYAGVLVILSLALLICGGLLSFLVYDGHPVRTRDSELLALPPVAMVILGALLMILIIIGCCAVCREAPVCMETYSTLLLILAIVQIGLGAWIISHYSSPITHIDLDTKFQYEIDEIFSDRNWNPAPMDNIQDWFDCCGKNGPTDYRLSKLPKSCCLPREQTCTQINSYQEGCAEAITEATIAYNFLLGWLSVAVGIAEIIGVILGFMVSCSVWRKQDRTWA